MGVAQAESKNPYSNQERGPTMTFSVIGKAENLGFAGLYTDGPPRDQVRASCF